MLDNFNCFAVDQKRGEGRGERGEGRGERGEGRGERGEGRFLSSKIHDHFFCFAYVELQIVFAAPVDK